MKGQFVWSPRRFRLAIPALLAGVVMLFASARVVGGGGMTFPSQGRPFLAAALPKAPAAPAPNAAAVLTPESYLGGASANILFTSDTQGYVGNPNLLSRRDRVVFQFDLKKYLDAGHVSSAVLEFKIDRLGVPNPNRFTIEVFSGEHAPLRKEDIIAADVTAIGSFLFDMQSIKTVRLDVTAAVNAALERGNGAIAFRVLDATIETGGGHSGKAEGGLLARQSIKLEVAT